MIQHEGKMMTRKHFERLASALHDVRPRVIQTGPTTHVGSEGLQWNKDVEAVCEVCKGFNPLFDADRFKQWAKEGPA